MFINPDTFGIRPGCEASAGFSDMFEALKGNVAQKTVTLRKGVYYFTSENAVSRRLYVTNTIGEDEYKSGEEKNIHRIALNLEGLRDLELDGQGSTFLLDGRMTNMVIDSCENITIKNINIETYKPDVHKLTVVSASTFYATFKLDEESDYIEEKGKYYWYGTDYKTDFFKNRLTSFWITTALPDNLSHLVRSGSHPLKNAISFKETAPRIFKVRYLSPIKYKEGQIFYIFSAKRTNVGIFAQNTKNLVLKDVAQRHNRSLAFVAQNCEDILLKNVDFSPRKGSEIEFTSFADFAQICMCRGRVRVCDSNFDSAGDDVINVHGFNFRISDIDGNKIKVKFCHPQSYGFECLREGDKIAFVDSGTLADKGNAVIVLSKMLDLYTFELELDTDNIPVRIGDVIEDISACPDFEFCGNTVNRVVTRGVLVTTRGKVLIEGNRFLNTGMSGILISDDASSWYESGAVRDVTIRANAFMNCDEQAILIKPENKGNEVPVHENILIENNLFCLNKSKAYNISGARNITIRNNVYRGVPEKGEWALFENTQELSFEDKPVSGTKESSDIE